MKLHLDGVLLQDKSDWIRIIESLDLSSLKTLFLSDSSASQLMLTTNAAHLLRSKFDSIDWNEERPKVIITSCTLHVAPLSESELLSIQDVLFISRLQHVNVECNSFSDYQSERIAQVVSALHWSTFNSPVLSGDNIDGWIQLLTAIVTPRSQGLNICATGLS